MIYHEWKEVFRDPHYKFINSNNFNRTQMKIIRVDGHSGGFHGEVFAKNLNISISLISSVKMKRCPFYSEFKE